MWVKTTCDNCLYLSLIRNLFLQILYWCSIIPVRKLLPAEGYNLLSFSNFSWKEATTPFALVLADVFTST